ncbi:MAG: GNAT family N-acetyltransferase [Myxococcota bacterium]
MKNIFKIVTLSGGDRIEIKSFNREDKKELISFLSEQNLYERVFFWMHIEPEEIFEEFERLLEKGNNIIVAFNKGRVAGIGFSKKYDEFYLRHMERYYLCIDKGFWGSGLVKEILAELVYLSLEDGKERVVVELLPEMKEHRREIELLEFEQITILPEFFMDNNGVRRDILLFANNLGNLWKGFEEGMDLEFKPRPMED